ncbi:cyclic nucleotide-gated channel rod photoreceptor subunit alpha-like isoform X2 [Mizuhopecten yessoensis]|uniref:Cyclic nucleotide-gated channel rod photoreceptor subunit alpha n=1 Tax=Mizuhopecten yessoensis TaxID=6573 RepID=A0A210PQ56_MIZYE|nr:cyclic nucleotide-gated channel rod photoreceptor subunit alpha-like isoform X2 [Mizuhopecten yessoensis]OWF38602.1 Cyclic nucleotide-gated channel rod photoreceptor subunit alpha [Mizuhopecten yessoensis]
METTLTTDTILHNNHSAVQRRGDVSIRQVWPVEDGRGERCSKDTDKASKSPQQEPTETRHNDVTRRVWDPDGNLCYNWMVVITTAALYNIVVIILRLGFTEMREHVLPRTVFTVLDLGCDVVYFFDIFVQSRMTYYEDGCLVSDVHKVFERYRGRKRFKLDVLSILPLHTVVFVCQGLLNCVHISIGFQKYHEFYISMTRLPRLLKAHTVSGFFDITDSRTSNPNCVRAIKLSLYLVLVIHWIGCLYYMVSLYEGIGSTEWAYSSGNYPDNFIRKYICCIYWSLLILTTIGERPPPQTNLEHVFTGLTFVIGVFIFAAVVGNVGDVISNLNASRQEFQARMDQIKFYLRHRNVPLPLQNRVKRWADYTWTRNQAMDEPQLLQMLPERLQMEIAIQVHLDTLKKVTIFEECEEGLLRELVLKLRPQIFSPGDYICHIGDIGREMYIINHGKIEIIVPCADTGQKQTVATLGAGNYFGEISLLKLDSGQNRRTADVRAVGYSELLRLSRKDLLTALVEYPDAKVILETQAKLRMKETMDIRNTNGEEPSPPSERQATEKSKRKRDWLSGIVQSEGFKRLVEHKDTELSELKTIVHQLRDYQTQVREKTNTRSVEKSKRLEMKLQQYEINLRKANSRIEELQQTLRSSCPCGKRSKSVTTDSPFVGRITRSSISDKSCRPLSIRKKCASEHYLERRGMKPLTGLDPSQTQLKRGRLFSNTNSIPITRSQINVTHSDTMEPVKQSSGYSSDTETLATLLRVSNALRLRSQSQTSTESNCDSSLSSDNDLESDWEPVSVGDNIPLAHLTKSSEVSRTPRRSCFKETNV